MTQPDPYREPFLPGQIYPPLGFAPDGTPRFQPGQQPVPQSQPQRPAGAPGPGVEPDSDHRRTPRSERRLVGILGVAALLALVLVAVTVGRAMTTEEQVPDAQQIPTIVPLPEAPPAQPGFPTDDPDVPRGGAPAPDQVPSSGKPVEYEVITSTPATIIYADDTGLRTVIGAPTTWSTRFTGSGMPLRVLVLAGEGTASCRISVGGRPVVRDEITAASPRRMVSCRG